MFTDDDLKKIYTERLEVLPAKKIKLEIELEEYCDHRMDRLEIKNNFKESYCEISSPNTDLNVLVPQDLSSAREATQIKLENNVCIPESITSPMKPTKNIFSVAGTSSIKPRFSLNASKKSQVKSR